MKNSGFDFMTFAHKLRALVTQLEKRTRIAKIQEYLYRHVASISIPKQLHCLDFRLANKHSTNATARLQLPAPELVPYLVENSFFHFVLASDNVLAASVVAASLVRNSLRPEKVVASMDWLEVSKYRCLVSAQQHMQEIIQDLYRVQQDPTKGTVHSGMIRQVIGISCLYDAGSVCLLY